MPIKIGELFVNSGLITEKQVSEALEIQRMSTKRIGEILIELGYITSQELNLMLSIQATKISQ